VGVGVRGESIDSSVTRECDGGPQRSQRWARNQAAGREVTEVMPGR